VIREKAFKMATAGLELDLQFVSHDQSKNSVRTPTERVSCSLLGFIILYKTSNKHLKKEQTHIERFQL